MKPLLVINKVDRLITELRLAPIEAHHHLMQLVEQVNAVMGGFFASERVDDEQRWQDEREKRLAAKKDALEDMLTNDANTSSLDDADVTNPRYEEQDDEDIYFAPEKGDVLFASAADGWAFRIGQFSQLHAKRLGIKEENLRRVLWGDYFYDAKTKRVISRKGLGKRSLKPLFVQLVLDNIWAVYDSISLNQYVCQRVLILKLMAQIVTRKRLARLSLHWGSRSSHRT